jgi:SAM-dependent methyltransferase
MAASESAAEHWESVYRATPVERASWYREHLEQSLQWIEKATGGRRDAAILDAGSGASTLVDDLLARGFSCVTVLEIAAPALEEAKRRLGSDAARVKWIVGDVTTAELPRGAFDIWHDRAVFHFLTRAGDRTAYVENIARSLKPGGQLIMSTFGPQGPTVCSGLDVIGYDAARLSKIFGDRFALTESAIELHRTPSGGTQQFLYCHFRMV